MRYVFIILIFISCLKLEAANGAKVAGYNLSEWGDNYYDANPNGAKTSAQIVVDQLYDLNVRHVVLNPRATMRDPRGSEILPVTPPADRSAERSRYARLIQYIHSKGMTVGIRPIFFVVNENGGPYIEKTEDGDKLWWHGNIQPADPNQWFTSFQTYLDMYIMVARLTKVEEFTIGAELYSMTVGIEDQWKKNPYGFPKHWIKILNETRSKLNPGTRIMYDINFTDDSVISDNIDRTGGELERWRYRLVDLANRNDPKEKEIWKEFVQFWTALDAIGIDMYRSFASKNIQIPDDYNTLVATLKDTSDRYATQLDNIMSEINMVLGVDKQIIFKEIGFRSVANGFVDPFSWVTTDPNVLANVDHQAAAMEAFFQSFSSAGWPWMGGVVFWDALIDLSKQGPMDKSFSPLGKKHSEEVLKTYFK